MDSLSPPYIGALSPRPSRRRSPMLLVAIVGVLAAFGAVAAAVGHRANATRAARFQEDALCLAPLAAPVSVGASACRVDAAQVIDRSIQWRTRTRVYNVTVRTNDGFVDSVELKGSDARPLWDATPVGTSVLVQRLSESSRSHVTVVEKDGLVSRTEWNPAWRQDDAVVGVVFLGAVAAIAVIALIVGISKARPNASHELSAETVRGL